MQADRRLVEDVADAAQIGAELRGEPDALRFAARQRRRRTIERQITQADEIQKTEPADELRHDVARDLACARLEFQLLERDMRVGDRARRDLCDTLAVEPHGKRFGLETSPGARLAGSRVGAGVGPGGFLAALLVIEIGELDARAVARGAPAVARVVREQARIERLEAAAARRAGARGGVKLAVRRTSARPSGTSKGRRQHAHHVAAELDGSRERIGELTGRGRSNVELRHGQLDVVLFEPVEPRPRVGRRQHAVDAQRTVAAGRGPVGELGVIALAADDERREQYHALAAVALHDLRMDRFEALRVDRDAAVGAMLHAELDEQEAQEVIDLGQRRDGALAAAAARALLDRDGRRNAVHGVDVGAAGGLDELARVRVQRLEVAALAFGEQDVERDRALAAAADARDDRELVARDRKARRSSGCARARARSRSRWRGRAVANGDVSASRAIAVGAAIASRASPGFVSGTTAKRACSYDARAAAVWPMAAARTAAGGPVATIVPPSSPPSGPRSMSQSAAAMTSRLCSMTTTECPAATRRSSAATSFATSAKCKPVVGSSNRNNVRPLAAGVDELGRELEPLRLAARQRRHGLPERQVLEPDVDERLQAHPHGVVAGEVVERLRDRHLEHVGDRLRHAALPKCELHLEHLAAIAPAIALGAAQIDVAQELHLDVLEAVAGAHGATPVPRVEAERRRPCNGARARAARRRTVAGSARARRRSSQDSSASCGRSALDRRARRR